MPSSRAFSIWVAPRSRITSASWSESSSPLGLGRNGCPSRTWARRVHKKLSLRERCKLAAGMHERVEGAAFHDPASVEDENARRVADGRQPVRDDERGPVL